jgi:hypothetical protein
MLVPVARAFASSAVTGTGICRGVKSVTLLEGRLMARGLLVLAGALLTIAGTVFALQGFGVLGGSVMSGSGFWAAAGPVIAVAGLVLITLGARRRPASRRS